MDFKEEGKKVVDAADEKLTNLTELVTRKGWTKWAVLGVLVLIVIVVGMILWPGKARATGMEHAIVQAVVVAKPVVPAVVTPAAVAPAAAAPAATAAAPPAAPAQQPVAGGGGGSSWLASGGFAFIGTGIFLTAAGVSHFIFCAQREEEWHKDNKVARCYNAERDGLPR